MLAAAEDALSDTLAQVLALAQGGGHDPHLAEFVRRFYSHAAPQDLDHYGPEALFGIAAGLTAWTGWDYFRKALPFLRDPGRD